jgi:tetratricopeptide (TPR) repeat protein
MRKRLINENEASVEIVKIIKNKEALSFFCGAGISRKFPAFAPLFTELRDKLLQSLLSCLRSKKKLKTRDLNLLSNRIAKFQLSNDIWIKPEVALHWFYSRIGDNLFDAFNIFNIGKSNSNHKILAKLASTNFPIAIATTNFDLYLENALSLYKRTPSVYGNAYPIGKIKAFKDYAKIDLDNVKSNVPILKIHGSLDEKVTIKATLNQIRTITGGDNADALNNLIKNRNLFIVGYSGNDYDIFPFLKAHAKYARSIYWFVRSGESIKQELFSISNLTLVKGDLNDFFIILYRSLYKKPFSDLNSFDKFVEKTNEWENRLFSWASNLNPQEVCYSLALFGLHIGYDELILKMCELLNLWEDGNLLYQIGSLNILANFYRKNDLSKALEVINMAEEKGSQLRSENPKLFGNILGTTGTILFQIGDYKNALKYLKRSNIWARKANLSSLLAANYDDFGNIYRHSGNNIKALYYHDKSLKIRSQINELIGTALCLNNIGLTYLEIGNYPKAEKYLLESIKLKKHEISHLPSLMDGLMNLGELYILSKKYAESFKTLKESLKYAQSEKNKILEIRCYYDLAEYYRCIKNLKKAKYYFKIAEKEALITLYWSNDRHRMKWINKIKENFSSNS